MLKNKRKFISALLAIVMIIATLNCSVFSVAAVGTDIDNEDMSNNVSPFSTEQILDALNNAEIIDTSEDSEFVLANSSVDVNDDYYHNELYAEMSEETNSDINENGRAAIGDPMVYYTQKWLNQEYGNVSGFVKVTENGKTGWNTIHGLIMALQHELGITSITTNFGPTTRKLYSENILKRQDGRTSNMYAILQCALWCKGYNPGYNFSYNETTGIVSINKVFDADVEKAVKQLQKDANLKNQDGVVSLNMMMALLSMDSFKLLPSSYGSDESIRGFQQWLNNNYEAYTGITPCDGVYGRNTNKALIYALQAEEGMPIGTANGNFGNATRLCCPTLPYITSADSARIYPGTSDCAYYSNSNITNFTKLLQFALYVNGFGNGNFNGIYDNATKVNIRNFQEHHAINVSGIADIGTWLSLFISCGDRNRAAIAADCATILTKPKADALYANGYRYIGRYLTGTYNGGISKALTRTEAEIILQAGLHFFPIYQTSARQVSYFTLEQGKHDANAAINAAKALGLPQDTIIYFAVDYDAIDTQITSNIIPYFEAISKEMSYSIYKTGVYGARNVCSRISEKGYACSSFVGDMSTGFSGNLGYKIPSNWAFDQFADKDASGNYLSIQSEDGSFAIDKDGFSGRDQGVSRLDDLNNNSNISISELGKQQTETMYGPTVNIFGNEVPLFQTNLSFNSKFANIETNYNSKTGLLEVLMGVNVFGKEVNNFGAREKAEKYKEAYKKTQTIVRNIGKNEQVFNSAIKDFKGSLYDRKTQVGFDYKSYVIGYMSINDKGEVVESGGAYLGETTNSIAYQIVPTVYAKFQIEGSLRGGFSLCFENGEISPNGNLEFAVKPSIGIEENLYIANAYAGLSGELSCSTKIPFISFEDDFEAYLNASAFFEWNALAWGARYDWKFIEQQLYPTSNNATALSISQNDLQFIKPIENIETTNDRSVANSDVFKENLQIYAEPSIINLGDGKMFMVYIDDSIERTDENRFILMYSIYDGTTWNVPQPIFDDGTADFEPVICADGNGGAHIVWQNANSVFGTDITLDQMSANTELYYTHWNGSAFVDTTAITSNNNIYEMSQRIASDGNKISVIWQENSSNSSFVVAGDNSIYRKQCIDGVWQQTESLVSGLSIINSMDTSYIDGENSVIYSAKTNKDSSAIDAFELFRVTNNEIIRLTNDDTPDYSVNFVDGKLYWISGDSIMLAKNGNVDNKQIVKTLNSTVSKIKVVRDTNNNECIVWETEDENGMTFYGINYNSVSDSFGNVYPLTTDNGVVRGWDVCFNPSGNIELAFCYADYTEGNQYGNLCLIQKQAEEYYDIYVSPNATYNGSVLPNNTITISTQICNTGSKVIEGFNVELINESGEMLQSTMINKEVGIGKNSDIEVPFTLPESISKTEYRLVVTPLNAVSSTFADNISNFTIGLPDVSVVNVEEIRDENLRQIKVTVKNEGYFPVSSTVLEAHADKYDGEVIGTNTITTIQPNEELDFMFTLSNSYSEPSASDKPKLIYVTLKTDDIENDYANNTFEYYVYPDYFVDVIAGTIGGYVAGSGIFPKDSIAKITAVPSDGYAFQGWYENGIRIFGAESIYLFSVLKNSSLEARFIKLNDCDMVTVSNKNVIVDKENKYLWGMPSGGKVEDYFVATDGGSIVQVENDSNAIINATGAQAKIFSKDGVLIDVYTVIIPGDVNGDSVIDAFDVFYIDRHINTANKLSGAYLAAADINRDGVVDESDYKLCNNLAFGILNSSLYVQNEIREQIRMLYHNEIETVKV